MPQKSVTVRLMGGLGNQLFCYAAARCIAERNHSVLILDTESGFTYDHEYERSYQLNHFRIQGTVASQLRCFSFPGGRFLRYALRKYSRLVAPPRKLIIEDTANLRYESWITDLKTQRSIWLEGFFQSYRYFEEIQGKIKQELSVKDAHRKDVESLYSTIAASRNAVGLGVRLYREVKRSSVHKVLAREYYLEAARIITSLVPGAHFFVFCSDREWVRQCLRLPYPHTVIEPHLGNEEAHKDLWLMTACTHFIIPNSTFHWWGAWLAESSAKIVVCPEAGFINKDTNPVEWIRVP